MVGADGPVRVLISDVRTDRNGRPTLSDPLIIGSPFFAHRSCRQRGCAKLNASQIAAQIDSNFRKRVVDRGRIATIEIYLWSDGRHDDGGRCGMERATEDHGCTFISGAPQDQIAAIACVANGVRK